MPELSIKDKAIRRKAELELGKRGVQTNLRAFTKELWPVIESVPFQDNWVIGALCEHLTACHEGQIRRLKINIYFRSLKSSLASVFYPAWVWGRKPEETFLYMAYAEKLAHAHADDMRDVIKSAKYKAIFPGAFALTKDTSGIIINDKRGERYSLGSDSQQTGFGARTKVFDDPNDTNKVSSVADRDSVNKRFDNLSTRSDDFSNSVWILIQQRTHPHDVSGHVEELGGLGFESLTIPLEYDGRKIVTSTGWSDPRTEIGEIADPLRFPKEEVALLKQSLGVNFSAQANQEPRLASGNAIKRAWYESGGTGQYIMRFNPEDVVGLRLAYDVAFSDDPKSDWTWGSLKAKMKDDSFLTLWMHFGHWTNKPRRENIAAFGLNVQDMAKELLPNIKWKLTEEAGIGPGVEVVKEDIAYHLGKGLPAASVDSGKGAKPVRAIAYLGACEFGRTKFYAGAQLEKYGMVNGKQGWIEPYLEIVTALYYSDDGLEFKGGKDDPVDSEVMAHEGLTTQPRNMMLFSPMTRKTT